MPVTFPVSRHFPPVWSRDLDPVAALVTHDFAAAPGAVVAAWVRRGSSFDVAVGAAGTLSPGGTPISPSTIFDLASVTKPFLALTAARLHRRAPLLDQPLGSLLSEACGTPSESIPIELFLAHRAGLDGHRPLFAPLLQGAPLDRSAALREAAMARRENCSGDPFLNGFDPVYSDLGYLLVGEAISRAENTSLEEIFRREVIEFIGGTILSASAIHQQNKIAIVAPTEFAEFRGGVVQGAVHDENAWAMGGLGVCGHAGLFSDASSVVLLGVLLLEALAGRATSWLTAPELEPLLRERPGGTLRAGFDGKSTEGSSAGSLFHRESFGHLGFTGTSLWIDPIRQLVAVLLCNRVHPTRTATAEQMKRVRPLVHDALARWADERK